MAAPMPLMLLETVNNIYRYLGYDDSGIDDNSVFQEPRISRQDPDKCDLCFTLVHSKGCAAVPAALLFPKFSSLKIKVDIQKVLQELPSVSEDWKLPIKSCRTSPNTLCMVLDHTPAFRNTIREILFGKKTCEKLLGGDKVICFTKDPALDDNESDLTQLRTLLAFQSLCHVCKLLGFSVVTECNEDKDSSDIKKYHICYKQHCLEKSSEFSLIHCGAVLDATTGMKANSITAREYYRNKKTAFEQVAQGRGNPKDDIDQATSLSEAEVAGELLWSKLHDNVSLNLSKEPDEVGVSRGATFLLYNHVRLSCIRRKFDQEVECGNYQKLPDLEAVDFGLLTQSEEWELLLLILQFSSWLVHCISPRGKFSLHPVLIGLDKLCRTFSVYYRRVRILTEPRPQLVPVMHARIYLLQCVEHILGMGLEIFNMKPLKYM